VFPLLLGMQSRPYLQATREVIPPEGEQRDEATIYTQIAQAAGVSLFKGKPLQLLLEALIRRQQRKHPERYSHPSRRRASSTCCCASRVRAASSRC
jgi:hypothetical protein